MELASCEHAAGKPAPEEYDPAGQDVHEEETPGELEYDPAGHDVHAEAPVEL